MFSKSITTSDAFREMPTSTQALYFHLGMEADDDGFLDNYKGLMRAINASEDDLKVLISKRFLILFPSKIIVVKHWLINNTVRVDRYKETKHLDEKRALLVKENGSYTELSESGIPNGNQLATQYRIGEDRTVVEADASNDDGIRIVEDSDDGEVKALKSPRKVTPEMMEVLKLFGPSAAIRLKVRKVETDAAKTLLELYPLDEIKRAVDYANANTDDQFCPRIHSPSDLAIKWDKLYAHKQKHG